MLPLEAVVQPRDGRSCDARDLRRCPASGHWGQGLSRHRGQWLAWFRRGCRASGRPAV